MTVNWAAWYLREQDAAFAQLKALDKQLLSLRETATEQGRVHDRARLDAGRALVADLTKLLATVHLYTNDDRPDSPALTP